jgi:hypothetical protein
MCLFTEPARVSNTRILVAALPDSKQLTVYENQATSETQNAMILPVPWGPGGVQMLDLSAYPTIWEDCERYFPVYNDWWGEDEEGDGEDTLPVQKVGGYNVTVVPSHGDLSRVDPAAFTLPVALGALLEQHYATGFGFIVCRFMGAVGLHPIGYISHADSLFFIPTRHEHEGSANATDASAKAEFDHTLYLVNTALVRAAEHGVGIKVSEEAPRNYIQWHRMTPPCPPPQVISYATRVVMWGEQVNQDLWASRHEEEGGDPVGTEVAHAPVRRIGWHHPAQKTREKKKLETVPAHFWDF